MREVLSDLPTDGANIHQAENNFTDDSNPGNVKTEDMTEEERVRCKRKILVLAKNVDDGHLT